MGRAGRKVELQVGAVVGEGGMGQGRRVNGAEDEPQRLGKEGGLAPPSLHLTPRCPGTQPRCIVLGEQLGPEGPASSALTSLEQAGSVASLQGTVPALKPELVLALKCTHAHRLHQCLGHTGVSAAHAPLLALQLQTVTGLVVCLGSGLWLQGQREDGQGLTAC